MPDPFVLAAREVLDEACAACRAAVDGLDAAALNARPAGDGTNSIAVLVVHAMHSTRAWLSTAAGTPRPPRDRDAEFRATSDGPDALLALLGALQDDCARLLDAMPAGDAWSAGRDVDARPDGRPLRVSAAWALLHALEHLREHAGHAGLTRQLIDNARAAHPGA